MSITVPVFRTTDELSTWLTNRAEALVMEANLAALAECTPFWEVTTDRVFRPDGTFFQVEGLIVSRAAGREVTVWRQPVITKDTGGTIAVAYDIEEDLFLLRTKAEPGNIGVTCRDGTNSRVLLSPTLQFSVTNIERHNKARRGDVDEKGQAIKPVPLADLLDDPDLAAAKWEEGTEDGGRFYEKVNRYGMLAVQDRETADRHVRVCTEVNDFAWVHRDVVREVREQRLLNSHLRSALSMCI